MWTGGSEQKQGCKYETYHYHPFWPVKINIIDLIDAEMVMHFKQGTLDSKTEENNWEKVCPSYPVYRIGLPSKLSKHRRRIQQHNWNGWKEARGNTTISNLSTHKMSYFHTGNWNISHKPVPLDIFYINRNYFVGWIFMSMAVYTVRATFLPLATQFGDWWIAVRLLSTVHSLPCHPFLPSTQLYLNLTNNNLLFFCRCSRDIIRDTSVLSSSYATKMLCVFHYAKY